MYFYDNKFIKLLFTHMFLLNGFVQLIPSHCQNVEQIRRKLLQNQFPDLHEFSKSQSHLNTFIISSGTKQTPGATSKGIKYLFSPSFPHP